MKSIQRTITPVDGSIYLTRKLASGQAIEKALSRATKAQQSWKRVPVAERAAICRRMADWCVGKADELATELSWQMGRPVSQTPGELKRGFHERALYMCSQAEERARRSASRSQAGLPALHPARAARRRAGRRALELPMADFRERGDSCAAGGQQRNPEDGGADAARRRTLRGSVQGRRPARRRIPVPASQPRPGRQDDRRPAHRVRCLHRLGSRRPGGAARRRRALHRHWSGARRQGPGLRARRRGPQVRGRKPGRRQLLQLRPVVLRYRANLCSEITVQRVRGRLRRAHAAIQAGQSAGEGNQSRTDGAQGRGRQRARADQAGRREKARRRCSS